MRIDGVRRDELPCKEALQFHILLDCAQNVLRGRGDQGVLASIADPVDRRRFASALWLEGADGSSFEFWCQNLQNLLCDNGIEPPCVTIDGDSVCPCGHPLSHHAQEERMGLAGVSRAWHLYTTCAHLDARIRHFRVQAVAQHPLLLDCVLQVAYGWGEPISRRSEAWQVLSSIDARMPLIQALCRFFRVGPAAVRAIRHWSPSTRQHWLTHATVRRAARLLVGLSHEIQRELDARALWRWLAAAHVIVQCTGVKPEYVMRAECLDGIDRLLAKGPVKRRELQGMLRLAIRWLRHERGRQGGLPRPSRLLSAIGLPLPPITRLDYCYALPCGWLAAPLESPDAIRAEGDTMHHCLRRYTNDVMWGDARAYSLRSEDGAERATLVTRQPLFSDEGNELDITIAGEGNRSMSIDVLTATLDLLRIVSPTVTRVSLW